MILAIDHKTKRMWLLKGCGTHCRVFLVGDLSTSRTVTIAGLLSLPPEPLSETTSQLLSHARYATSATAREKTPEEQSRFLSVPAASFGFRVTKMHKKTQDERRQMDYELLLKDTKLLAKDDQRSVAFLVTHESAFANSFPVNSDPNSNFDSREFELH
jgi:hypothetical protein